MYKYFNEVNEESSKNLINRINSNKSKNSLKSKNSNRSHSSDFSASKFFIPEDSPNCGFFKNLHALKNSLYPKVRPFEEDPFDIDFETNLDLLKFSLEMNHSNREFFNMKKQCNNIPNNFEQELIEEKNKSLYYPNNLSDSNSFNNVTFNPVKTIYKNKTDEVLDAEYYDKNKFLPLRKDLVKELLKSVESEKEKYSQMSNKNNNNLGIETYNKIIISDFKTKEIFLNHQSGLIGKTEDKESPEENKSGFISLNYEDNKSYIIMVLSNTYEKVFKILKFNKDDQFQ